MAALWMFQQSLVFPREAEQLMVELNDDLVASVAKTGAYITKWAKQQASKVCLDLNGVYK